MLDVPVLDPVEAAGLGIELVQGAEGTVEAVQVPQRGLQPPVQGGLAAPFATRLQEVPVQAAPLVPLPHWPSSPPMKRSFFPGWAYW